MEPNLNQDRRQAHALLDMLPAKKLNAVRRLLEVMVEPLSRSLALMTTFHGSSQQQRSQPPGQVALEAVDSLRQAADTSRRVP